MPKDTSTRKFGKQAHTFRVNPSASAPRPQPAATGSFNVIQSDGTMDMARIMSNDNPNAPVLGPNTLAYYQQRMPGQNPYEYLKYAPYPMPAARPTDGQAPSSAPFYSMPGAQQRMVVVPHQNPYEYLRYAPYPMPPARPTHGQAPSSAPFYSYSPSMPGANPTVPQYPRPSSVPTMARTARGQATPSAPMYYYPPMPTAKPPAPLNSRPSRIPTMNPYPDSDATTPESTTDKEDPVPSRPAPDAVQNFPATTSPVDAPPAKAEKKKFLTIRGCGWLRGVPADVYARTELASDKFVPATLDEDEEKAFDDFLNPDMIED
ncbi:hypothetical protein BDZ89DRAFT_1048309 [Hymenopellis radicata]|nr:hypothetical protein BDZ89DRAFT_1048309 [Hymenopellis radicata]